jgi:3-isopropylmalate/(R)-2-methylmalate dehydratase small subunit
LAIKGVGVAAVLAELFARIFFRNSINTGLLALEVEGVHRVLHNGDRARIEPQSGSVINLTKGMVLQARPIPPFIQEILDVGGLMAYAKKKLQAHVR